LKVTSVDQYPLLIAQTTSNVVLGAMYLSVCAIDVIQKMFIRLETSGNT